MSYIVGICLVAFGLVAIIFGGKNVQDKVGSILHVFATRRLNAAVLKWAIGLLCIWFGVAFLFGGIKL